MSNLDLRVRIVVQDVGEWLDSDQPGWSTAVRFHAANHEADGVVVLTATSPGVVGYAVWDRRISHLCYMETRKNCRRRGVASCLWAWIREDARRGEVTATEHSEDGKRRLVAWGFVERDGVWTWRAPR